MNMQTAWDPFAVQSNELLNVRAKVHNPFAWTFVAKVNTQWIIANTSLPYRRIGFLNSLLPANLPKTIGKIFDIYLSFGYKGICEPRKTVTKAEVASWNQRD